MAPASRKEFLDIQANDMITTSSHIEFILEEVLLKADKWNVSVMKKKTNFFE